ncbi:MAG: lipoyl synthase [Acidobacteria bacterium]|nr:lipoyl synthase [Acidobacteriota bacterium]MCI0622719.1 lipoyl synthase [Acidobacteriota bacterium]MCI0718913.1 lipoyl synthase [Acidobacteriota bacterium]
MPSEQTDIRFSRHPAWLRVRFPGGENFNSLKKLVRAHALHTVCESANCPNIGECWDKGTATFMILGNVCTRRCGFCAVKTGRPEGYDVDEPIRVARAVQTLGLKHAVVTSVDRDDLADEGSWVFGETIRKIRELNPETNVEVLIPDFKASAENLARVIQARPDVLAHNLDTVPRLYAKVKPKSSYDHSLNLLRQVKRTAPHIRTKAGLMLGLGEEIEEIHQAMDDVLSAKADILTIGQYLRPSLKHLPLLKHYHPDEFLELKRVGERKGIPHVESGPLVRSSYHAAEQVHELLGRSLSSAFPILACSAPCGAATSG